MPFILGRQQRAASKTCPGTLLTQFDICLEKYSFILILDMRYLVRPCPSNMAAGNYKLAPQISNSVFGFIEKDNHIFFCLEQSPFILVLSIGSATW